MTDFRPIDAALIAKPDGHPTDPGAVPMLQWIDIERLVVDPAYQRDITRNGKTNVRRIAQVFRWSRFSPVIVSPVAGGKLAIVDGQHRTTAALLRGFTQVPCQVILADQAEQADAFRAVNGAVTRMTSMQIHAAAVVAGDPLAVRLAQICAEAGVEILRSNTSADRQSPGQTHAAAALARARRLYGDDTLRTALRCVTQTSNNVPGGVNAIVISALTRLLGTDADMRHHPRLLDIFDQIEIEQEAATFWQGNHARSDRNNDGFVDHLRTLVTTRLNAL